MKKYPYLEAKENLYKLKRNFYAFLLCILFFACNIVCTVKPCVYAEEIVLLTDSAVLEENESNNSIENEPERFSFYGNEKTEFLLECSFMSAAFKISDDGTELTSLKNIGSDFEWINGRSVATLTDVYYDSKSIRHEVKWNYYGCHESDKYTKLIFEFKSLDEKLTCRQAWSVEKSETDGAVLVMSYETEVANGEKLKFPERFSAVTFQLASQQGFGVQYLDGVIKEEIITEDSFASFKIGNGNGFDMSVPLYYFYAPEGHGIAVGGGAFSTDCTTVLDVAVSGNSMMCINDAGCMVVEKEKSTIYACPSFFLACYTGNVNAGKNFIKNWNGSASEDSDMSLPLTYANTVGEIKIDTVDNIRKTFYNMLFYFSVSDARQNICEIVKDELEKYKDAPDMYKYILRSAVFCDFDYTKVGLTDGTAIKKSAAEHDELYRNSLASVMLNGRQYPVFEGYEDGGWDGIEFYDSVNEKGVIFIFKNSDESDSEKVIAVHGVSENTDYKVSSLDGRLSIDKISGKELLKKGLTVSVDSVTASDILFIEEAGIDFADVKILLFGNELTSLELIAIAAALILLIGIVITVIIFNAQEEYTEKKF